MIHEVDFEERIALIAIKFSYGPLYVAAHNIHDVKRIYYDVLVDISYLLLTCCRRLLAKSGKRTAERSGLV